MTDSERWQKICETKSFGKPPKIEDDLYYEKSPWCNFASVWMGIGEITDWYKDEIIFDMATDDEIETVYNYMKNHYENRSANERIELKPDYFRNIPIEKDVKTNADISRFS